MKKLIYKLFGWETLEEKTKWREIEKEVHKKLCVDMQKISNENCDVMIENRAKFLFALWEHNSQMNAGLKDGFCLFDPPRDLYMLPLIWDSETCNYDGKSFNERVEKRFAELREYKADKQNI